MDLATTSKGSSSRTLTPEQRLIDAISRFGLLLDSFGTSKSLKATFKTLKTQKPPTAADIIGLTEEINRDGQRMHPQWKPYGSRLLRVLEQLQIFTKTGDVLIGGSQNMIASGVWAAVKLSLQLAIGQLNFFDQVSSLLMRVGKTVSVQSSLVHLFPSSAPLHDFSREYLIVLVQFCGRVVTLASQSLGAKILSSFTTSFEREFKDFEGDLNKWATLIDQQWRVLMAESLQRTEKKGDDSLAILRSLRKETQKREIDDRQFQIIEFIRRVCPEQDEFDATWLRERRKGSCKWIFETDTFKAWKKPSTSIKALCITGHLGSGKTVLMANVVSHLKCLDIAEGAPGQVRERLVVSFFFQRKEGKIPAAQTVIQSILRQILRTIHSKGTLTTDQCARLTTLNIRRSPSLIQAVVDKTQIIYAVLDGIDECPIETADEIFQWFRELGEVLSLRLCFSNRVNAPVQKLAEDIFKPSNTDASLRDAVYSLCQISMNNPGRVSELSAYIAAEIERRKHVRSLEPHLLDMIQNALISGAQGMYLWAVLQLDAIFPRYQTSIVVDADVARLLQHLPRDLHQAINRSLAAINDKRYGTMPFRLVAAAARSMKVAELAVALNVVDGDQRWNPATLVPETLSFVYLCSGGLLEVDEEQDTVHFIHHSILSHLTSISELHHRPEAQPSPSMSAPDPHFSFSIEEAITSMALKCITYLSYDCHDKTSTTRRSAATVDTHQVADQLVKSSMGHHKTLSRVINITRPKRYSDGPTHLDLYKILDEHTRRKSSSDRVSQFLDYANTFWVEHTKAETASIASIVTIFRKLIDGHEPHIQRPWSANGPPSATSSVTWAAETGHAGIWSAVLATEPDLCCEAVEELWSRQKNMSLDSNSLGNIVSYCVDRLMVHWTADEVEAILRWLLQHGADPALPATCGRRRGFQPLQILLLHPSTTWIYGTLNCLLESGAALMPHTQGEPPLCLALSTWGLDHVRQLLSHGADPNTAGRDEMTPLGMAVKTGNQEAFKLLLDAGAAPFSQYNLPRHI